MWSANTLLPRDYYGLGLDTETGTFSLQLLDEHLVAVPAARDAALSMFFDNAGVRLVCQAIACSRAIKNPTGCAVAWCCNLSVFCMQCAASQLPCRQCMRRCTIDEPVRYMMALGPAICAVLDAHNQPGTVPGGQENENRHCYTTLIELLAPVTLYSLSLKATRVHCGSSS